MSEQRTEEPVHEDAADELTERDHLQGVDVEGPGGMRMAISNAMVGLKKRYYGKGPQKARTFVNDNYVFCVLEGGLTRNEETLLEAGEEDLVRQYRLKFQEAMAGATAEAIERITGRKVIGYHSQIVFGPARGFEIFVLDAAP